MNDELKKSVVARVGQWKWPLIIMGMLLLDVCGYAYVAQSWYPLYGANRTPGRAWSAWDADHNVDGMLNREEMKILARKCHIEMSSSI